MPTLKHDLYTVCSHISAVPEHDELKFHIQLLHLMLAISQICLKLMFTCNILTDFVLILDFASCSLFSVLAL